MVSSRCILQWTEPFSYLDSQTIFYTYITEALQWQTRAQKGQETFPKALTSLQLRYLKRRLGLSVAKALTTLLPTPNPVGDR